MCSSGESPLSGKPATTDTDAKIQLLPLCTFAQLAYEEWDLVKAALTSWRAEGQSVEWVAGYEVHSVQWTDQQAANGDCCAALLAKPSAFL